MFSMVLNFLVWFFSRAVEIALGAILLLTLSDYYAENALQIYDISEYVKTAGLILFAYTISGYFVITLYIQFLYSAKIFKLVFFNIIAFAIVSLFPALYGVGFGNVYIYIAHGALILFSSAFFGLLVLLIRPVSE